MSLEAPQSVKNGTDADAMPPMPPPPQPASKPRLCRRCGQVKKGHTCTNPPPKEGAKNGSNGSHSNGSNGSSTPSPEGPSPEGPTFSGGEFSDQPVLASGGANPILTTSTDVGGAASWPASMTKDNWETPKDTWKSQKAEGRTGNGSAREPLPPLTKQLRGRKEVGNGISEDLREVLQARVRQVGDVDDGHSVGASGGGGVELTKGVADVFDGDEVCDPAASGGCVIL